jgi:hypothetical protein
VVMAIVNGVVASVNTIECEYLGTEEAPSSARGPARQTAAHPAGRTVGRTAEQMAGLTAGYATVTARVRFKER